MVPCWPSKVGSEFGQAVSTLFTHTARFLVTAIGGRCRRSDVCDIQLSAWKQGRRSEERSASLGSSLSVKMQPPNLAKLQKKSKNAVNVHGHASQSF